MIDVKKDLMLPYAPMPIGLRKQFYPPPANCVFYAPGYPPMGATTLVDHSGNSNTGTIYQAVWTRLPSGLWVLNFDGVDDKVSCAAAAPANIAGALSFGCWVKLDVVIASQPDTAPYIVSKQVSGPTNRNFIILITKATDILTFLGRNAAGNANIFSVAVASIGVTYLDDLKWHHLFGVWDRTNTTAYIYIDGVERGIATGQTNGDLYTATNGALSLATATAVSDTFLDGSMALEKLISGALSVTTTSGFYQQERHLFGV